MEPPPAGRADPARRLLVYSRTTGFRHESIPAGIAALRELGEGDGWVVDTTEDPDAFAAGLELYLAVVFLNTSGEVLTPTGRMALEAFIAAGHGYVGVHLAAGTEYDWPFYGELVGAYFDGHPHVQPGTIVVEDPAHPATAHLTRQWSRSDEWYNFRTNPRSGVRVLASLDESSISGGTMGADHPITWCREYGGGRAFYTGLGHTIESYREEAFRGLLLGGVRWAAGLG